MYDLFVNLFSSGNFIPHGHCYLWKPSLVWLHLISDSLIVLAYYSIPFTLFHFVRKRQDLPFRWIFLLFAAFIISCGTTHLAQVWTLWHPTYWLSGTLKAGTAAISLWTAIELIPLIPKALALPSPTQLSQTNQALRTQIADRLRAEAELKELQDELEQRVRNRTAELVGVNQRLQKEIEERQRVETALRASRERLVLAQQIGKIGACEWNIKTGELIWTEEMEILYGLAPGSFEGRYEYWIQRLHPEDRSNADRVAQHTANDGTDFDTEFRIMLPEGEVRWVAARAQVFYDDFGKPDRLIGVNMDITDRKQAEAALRKSEAKFRRLSDANIVGVISANTQGMITDANEAFLNMVGYTQAEVLAGKVRWDEMTPSDLKHLDEPALEELMRRGVHAPYEKEYLHRNGQRVPILVGSALLENDSENVISFILDITEHKRSEAALRASEERFQLMTKATNDVVWDCDLKSNTMWWSGRTQIVFGYQPKELGPNMTGWVQRVHPDDLAGVHASYEACLNSKETVWTDEYRFRRANGSYANILDRAYIIRDRGGIAIRIVGAMSDITERKQAEQASQERNERLQLLYETTRELLSAKTPLELMHHLFNRLAEAMELHYYYHFQCTEKEGGSGLQLSNYSGLSEEEVRFFETLDLGQAMCGLVAQDRRQIVLNRAEIAVHPHAQNLKEMGVSAYAGQPLMVQGRLLGTLSFASLTRTQFTAEEVDLLQAISEQVSIALERTELVASLQQQTEDLAQANRIKDEFLAVLSHELRSPLNPILGWTKLLQAGNCSPQRMKQALEIIERNVKQQTQLIDDLLDISRILRGKIVLSEASVDLAFTIEVALETVRLAAEAKNIQIGTKLDASLPPVLGDGGRLQQIVLNLLSNAIKFTPQGGRVEVWLERIEQEAQIQVKDTGKGISPTFLPYVFESFRQEDSKTTRRFGGLGLGLAIVRQLTELHGGTVRAESPGEGEGATFTIRLPLMKPQGSNLRHSYPAIVPAKGVNPLQGIRVLITDDEADMRELLATILEESGAIVYLAASAAEALTAFRQFHPALLISDIGMPDMDGYMLIQQVRALPPEQGGQIPAIALTAYAGEVDRQQALQSGFQKHVSKPVEPIELTKIIADLLRVATVYG